MAIIFKKIIIIMLLTSMQVAAASQYVDTDTATAQKSQLQQNVEPPSQEESTPQVGKHAIANVDASSMILSLLMVLAVVVISALLLKRFNLVQANTEQLKVVASLSLGAKERLVIVQIGEQQLALGVTAQQITLIESLAEPLNTASNASLPMTSNVMSFLQKTSNKPSKSK